MTLKIDQIQGRVQSYLLPGALSLTLPKYNPAVYTLVAEVAVVGKIKFAEAPENRYDYTLPKCNHKVLTKESLDSFSQHDIHLNLFSHCPSEQKAVIY